ncbi:hypothetical protein, partial [Saliphagus infecundisoli]|uniref:hypothetical protein n=1 Tax=Saliphagus infecundisoli TaxID=1849069 RepID=UPI001CD285B7
ADSDYPVLITVFANPPTLSEHRSDRFSMFSMHSCGHCCDRLKLNSSDDWFEKLLCYKVSG